MAVDQDGMRQLDSLPPPSMMQQQMHNMQPAAYSSNGHHTPEPYRDSPSHHHPPLHHAQQHLPPIHQYEGGSTMQSQPPYVPSPMNGAQMPPHPQQYNPHQYQYQNGAMQPAPMPSNGQNGMLRFPIPPQNPIPMGHARGAKNKEVKRRTKTGCLTCRKRRIKCDETHPTCRNCAKSKRECLGYDPIFKQQPGPAPIQPAPASTTTTTTSQKSAPSQSTTYQPSPSYPGSGSSFISAGGNLIPSGNQSHGVDGPFEYGASLDPALSGGDAALTMAANTYSSILQPTRPVKHITIDQLFSLNDVPPQYQEREAPPLGSMPPQREVDDYYRYHYAPGLDKLFETNWYSTRGLHHLQQDPSLLDYTAQCMERMSSQSDNTASINACKSLEARLIWHLASLPRLPPNGLNGTAPDQLTADLLPRIDTLEALLTGQFLPRSHLPPPPTPHTDEPTLDRHTFWHELAHFTSLRDDLPAPETLREVNASLALLRGMLRGLENRDVLYSIALARHVGGRMVDFDPLLRVVLPPSEDPHDEVKKLQVACDFVAAEERGGTTQVVQRVCGMAVRGWVLGRR